MLPEYLYVPREKKEWGEKAFSEHHMMLTFFFLLTYFFKFEDCLLCVGLIFKCEWPWGDLITDLNAPEGTACPEVSQVRLFFFTGLIQSSGGSDIT